MSADFKVKYKELRAKVLESNDMSYRLGFEAGLKQAAQDNAQMQIQQLTQQAAAMQGQQIDPATGQPVPGAQEQPGEQQVDENGQPIDPTMQDASMGGQPMQDAGGQPPMEEMAPGQGTELDMYINELEELVAKGEKPTVTDLRKAVTALADVRKAQKLKMKENKPAVISAQKSMVDNILKGWAKESTLTADNLEERIKSEGLKL